MCHTHKGEIKFLTVTFNFQADSDCALTMIYLKGLIQIKFANATYIS